MKTWIVFAFTGMATLSAAQDAMTEKTLLPVQIGNKWGYINDQGKMELEPVYDAASRFTIKNNMLARVVLNGNAYVIDKTGQKVYDPRFYNFRLLNDSVFAFFTGGYWGLFNFNQEKKTSPIYSKVALLQNQKGRYLVNNKKGYGLLNEDFEVVIPCVYQSIRAVNGLYIISREGNYGLLSFDNKLIMEPRYSEITMLSDRYCWVSDSLVSGIIDLRHSVHEMVLSLDSNSSLRALDTYYALLEKDTVDSLWIVDLEERKITHLPFVTIDTLKGQTKRYEVTDSNGLFGVWSPEEGIIMDTRYADVDWADPFFLAMSGGYWFLHSGSGDRMSKEGYDQLQVTDKGVFVFKYSQIGLLNMEGAELIPIQFLKIWWHGNVFKCRRGNQVALFEIRDMKVFDRMLIETNAFTTLDDDAGAIKPVRPRRTALWFQDEQNGMWGLKSVEGEVVIKPQFDDVRTIYGTPFAIVTRHLRREQRMNYNSLSPSNRTIGSGIVNEETKKLIFPPVLDYIDERCMHNPNLDVIRVRRWDGMFTTISKENGRVVSSYYLLMDTFSSNRARVMTGGRLIPGKKEHRNNFDDVIGSDHQLFQGLGIESSNMTYIINKRLWYMKRAEWGYIDGRGAQIKIHSDEDKIPAKTASKKLKITRAEQQIDGYSPIEIDENWYLMDSTGHFSFEHDYSSLEKLNGMNSTYYLARTYDPAMGVLDKNGNIIHAVDFDDVRPFNNGVAWARKDGNWGILKSSGEWIDLDWPARRVADFSDGYGAAVRGGTWVFVDTALNAFRPGIKFDIRNTSGFSEGLAAVQIRPSQKNGLNFGYLDTALEWAIEPRFQMAYPFVNNRARVKVNGKIGYIDRNGKYIRRSKYARANDFDSSGLATVLKKGGWGALSSDGKVIVPCQYHSISMQDGYIHAFKHGVIKVYTFEGRVIRKIKGVKNANGLKDGVNAVLVDRNWGYLHANGTWLSEPKYTYASNFNNGVALIGTRSNTWSITKNLDTLAHVSYRIRGDFSNNIVRCMENVNGRYMTYYLNATFSGVPYECGEGGCTVYFAEGTTFHDGMAAVKMNGRWGMIDTMGTVVVPPIYGRIIDWDQNGIQVGADYHTGLVDFSGKPIVPVECEEITILKPENVVYIKKNAFNGYMDLNGEWIWRSDYSPSMSGK